MGASSAIVAIPLLLGRGTGGRFWLGVWCSFLGFLYSTLVPRLYTSVSTNTTYGIGLVLINVATVQANPGRFSVLIFSSFGFAIRTTVVTMVTLYVGLNVRGIVVSGLRCQGCNVGVILRVQCFCVTSYATK